MLQASPQSSLWSRRWFINLLRLAAVVMVLATLGGTFVNALGGLPERTDFLQFYASALAYRQQHGMYNLFIYLMQMQQIFIMPDATQMAGVSQNLNPPAVSLLLIPLTHLDLRIAYYIFCFAQFALALGVFWKFIGRTFGHHPILRPAAILALASYFPVLATLLIGQLGLLLLVLLLMGWMALEDGKLRTAGIWLGLALLLKVFVGLVFVWLALTRQWLVLFWGALVFTLGMLGALLLFGADNHFAWLQAIKLFTAEALSWNASLEGVYARYLGAGNVVSHYNVPLVVLGLRVLSWVGAAAALIWLARQPQPQIQAIGFAMTLPLMLLLAPLGWIYYFPLLLVSAALLWRTTDSKRAKGGITFALILGGLPQLLSGGDFYTPVLWKGYDKGGYIATVNGVEEKVLYGAFYWFEVPEVYTLALILFVLLSLRIAYSLRSAHTGA